VIPLGSGLAAIPERLLLAHARGEVLFIAGAGISRPASLPDFRGLVLKVYAQLDAAVHAVISGTGSHMARATSGRQ
jgi:NAD-dependent SIR2 family protein deacetylase